MVALEKTLSTHSASLNMVEDFILSAARAFTLEIILIHVGRTITCVVGPRCNADADLTMSFAESSTSCGFWRDNDNARTNSKVQQV